MKYSGGESDELLSVSHSPVPFTLAGHRNHACVVVSPSSAAWGQLHTMRDTGFGRGQKLVAQPSCDGEASCPHRHVAASVSLDQLLPGWQMCGEKNLKTFTT